MITERKKASLPLSRLLVLSLLLWLGLLASACTDKIAVQSEEEEPAFRRGVSLQKENRYDEALAAFLQVIQKRPDAEESHLRAGTIFLDQLNDPVRAIYHFDWYLERAPESEKAEVVRQMIQSARKEFARQLPAQPFGPEGDQVGYAERYKEMQEEILGLKKRLVLAERRLTEAQEENNRLRDRVGEMRTAVTARSTIDNTPQATQSNTSTSTDTPSTYEVKTGDTLSRISTKVYGSSGRWRDIFEANRDQLPNPNALKVGQTLNIP